MCLSTLPSIPATHLIAKKDTTMKVIRMGRSFFQGICFHILMQMYIELTRARSPERAVASP